MITHGFVLDEHGIPYSKSDDREARKAEGKKINYIEPDAVIKKSGAELFRLWVASMEFRTDITYSQTILDGLAEWYRKLRNTARFLLGNLKDFDPDAHDRSTRSRSAIDRYMLARLDDVVARARKAYEAYELHVVHRLLVDFVTVDLSAFYCDVTKDRLYSDAVDSPRAPRRAGRALRVPARDRDAAAPILCFTAEDIWKLHAAARRRSGQRAPRGVPGAARPTTPTPSSADFAVAARVARARRPRRSSRSARRRTSRSTRA